MNAGLVIEAAVAEGIRLPISTDQVEAAVRHVLTSQGVTTAEFSLAFLGDDEIARLNERYLAHQGATDVISFALHADDERPLGDVYIGFEQAGRQAADLGVPLEEELLRLVIHGTLHVLAYDHPVDADREHSPMYRRQEELLDSFLKRNRPSGC